jgi:hypothetical protein
MSDTSLIHVCMAALCLLAACDAGAQQTGTAGRERVERVEVAGRRVEVSPWFRAESQHFVVYSDTRQEDVSTLLDNLEKLDHVLRIYTQPVRKAQPQEAKLTLYYHSRASDLRQIDDGMPADAVGLYSSCAAGVQGFVRLVERVPTLGDAELDKSPLDETLSFAFEAYARHFLYRHTDIRTPRWFLDGFAQYFSSMRFSERQMVVGRAPKVVAEYLRHIDSGQSYSLEYDAVLRYALANARSLGGAEGVRLEFEAKSWLLMHHMLASDTRRRQLSRYLTLVEDGASPLTAFESVFAIKADDISTVMWRYGLKGLEVLRVDIPELPAVEVRFRSLSRAAGEFLLPDAALKSCPGRPAGDALLKKVASLHQRFPDDAFGRLVLSRAQIDWGDARDAVPALQQLLDDDEARADAHHLLGMARLRLAERSEGGERAAGLQDARRHLQRAQALQPGSPEIAVAAFRCELAAADYPREAALESVISAWRGAREVAELNRAAALAHAYAGNADEAFRALAVLAYDQRDPRMAEWAGEWQNRLRSGVTRRDILAEMRRVPPVEVASKAWTIDNESVLAKVKLAAGMQAAQAMLQQQKQQQGTPPLQDFNSGKQKK